MGDKKGGNLMGSFEEGAGFRVCGTVVRNWISPTGKFAALTLDVNRSPRGAKIEMRAFHRGSIDDIRILQPGQRVKCTGQIDWEPIKNKAREEIKIDGYQKWVAVLSILSVEVEGSSRLAAPTSGEKTASPPAKSNDFDDSDPGFGESNDKTGKSKPGDPFDGDIPF